MGMTHVEAVKVVGEGACPLRDGDGALREEMWITGGSERCCVKLGGLYSGSLAMSCCEITFTSMPRDFIVTENSDSVDGCAPTACLEISRRGQATVGVFRGNVKSASSVHVKKEEKVGRSKRNLVWQSQVLCGSSKSVC
jgi:hypothetical protein